MSGRPLNVLYVVRTWAMGGGQTIVLMLMKHLDPAKFNIIAVPYDAPGDGDDTFAAAVERIGGKLADERVPWKSRGNFGNARDAIGTMVDEYDVDLIHTHDPQSNVLVGLNRKHFPCACVASPYGWWDRLLPLRSHVYTWVEKNIALPRFDRLITVSETMKRNILKGRTPEHKIRVINTGIGVSTLDRGKSRNEVRHELGIPGDGIVAGTVSRIYVEKGHQYLLQAAKPLCATNKDFYVLIVGDGPLRPKLEQQARDLGIADKVVFTGFYDDLPGALRAMDIFVLPSILDEGFPTSVLEAEALGLPVIASDTGGTHETIQPDRTGLLIPPKDPAALHDALQSLITDSDRRGDMGAAAKQFVRSSFTLDAMTDKIARTYHEAIENYRAS